MRYIFFLFIFFLTAIVSAQQKDVAAVKLMTQRVAPQYASNIQFEDTSDSIGNDAFEIEL